MVNKMQIKTLGHIVDDGEGLWMISSAAEIGFRVTGATRVTLELLAAALNLVSLQKQKSVVKKKK